VHSFYVLNHVITLRLCYHFLYCLIGLVHHDLLVQAHFAAPNGNPQETQIHRLECTFIAMSIEFKPLNHGVDLQIMP
jgi:hypothetical protein